MTEQELQIEHRYRYEERLALLGQFGQPTPEQHKIATDEADEVISKLRADIFSETV